MVWELTTQITHSKKSCAGASRINQGLAAINTFMKYTKPWLIADSVESDAWHQWLAVNAVQDLDYQVIYRNETVAVEFFDQDRAAAFAAELGL